MEKACCLVDPIISMYPFVTVSLVPGSSTERRYILDGGWEGKSSCAKPMTANGAVGMRKSSLRNLDGNMSLKNISGWIGGLHVGIISTSSFRRQKTEKYLQSTTSMM
jgi:hypothetical protein